VVRESAGNGPAEGAKSRKVCISAFYLKLRRLHSMSKCIQDYPDVLTVEEASEIIGICSKTVYKLIKNGELKKVSVGRLFKIPKMNILIYLGIA